MKHMKIVHFHSFHLKKWNTFLEMLSAIIIILYLFVFVLFQPMHFPWASKPSTPCLFNWTRYELMTCLVVTRHVLWSQDASRDHTTCPTYGAHTNTLASTHVARTRNMLVLCWLVDSEGSIGTLVRAHTLVHSGGWNGIATTTWSPTVEQAVGLAWQLLSEEA